MKQSTSHWKTGNKSEKFVKKTLVDYELFNGVELVSASGSKTHSKEDIVNNDVLIQVKGCKSNKINVLALDMRKLESNAAKKMLFPVFCLHFYTQNKLLILIKMCNLVVIKDKMNLPKVLPILENSKTAMVFSTDCMGKVVTIGGESYSIFDEKDFKK